MLPYKRSQRVGDLLREEISKTILNRLKDPRIGFITVTGVDITDDLKLARVYITVFNKDDTIQTLKILNTASSFIRKEIGRNIKIKNTPQLEFFEDQSYEYGEKIDHLLNQTIDDEQDFI